MDATIEEFGKLYPAYATLYFKDECEIVETAPKSDLDFRRLVVSGGEGYAFPRELAGDSVSFYSKAGCQEPMLLNSDGIFFAEVDGRKCLFVCELKRAPLALLKSAMPRNRLWEHYCACRLSLAFYSLFLNGNTME